MPGVRVDGTVATAGPEKCHTPLLGWYGDPSAGAAGGDQGLRIRPPLRPLLVHEHPVGVVDVNVEQPLRGFQQLQLLILRRPVILLLNGPRQREARPPPLLHRGEIADGRGEAPSAAAVGVHVKPQVTALGGRDRCRRQGPNQFHFIFVWRSTHQPPQSRLHAHQEIFLDLRPPLVLHPESIADLRLMEHHGLRAGRHPPQQLALLRREEAANSVDPRFPAYQLRCPRGAQRRWQPCRLCNQIQGQRRRHVCRRCDASRVEGAHDGVEVLEALLPILDSLLVQLCQLGSHQVLHVAAAHVLGLE
mmetsp:Transcript_59491/g.160333  ORF Transcript_59491/g.160333 Transcript_59491/m.160333 type:complete len:304 (-) Transcript_59491:81-992(-)